MGTVGHTAVCRYLTDIGCPRDAGDGSAEGRATLLDWVLGYVACHSQDAIAAQTGPSTHLLLCEYPVARTHACACMLTTPAPCRLIRTPHKTISGRYLDQRFSLASNGNLQLWSGGHSPCVALESGSGPVLVMHGCITGPNEVFAFNCTIGTL
jgi:hypothetical protein